MEPAETTKLNNELLSVAKPDTDEPEVKKPKRNSKEELLSKILKVVEKYELDFDYSDTRLKRMNKQELTKVLAVVMEDSVRIDMAKSIGVDPSANGKVVTLTALRMIHNLCATGFEKVWNNVGSKYTGYDVEGFATTLRDPTLQNSIDECLLEIAAENPEILQYFDSPYTRLALVWSGALISCIKRKSVQLNRHAQHLGSRTNPRPNPASSGGGGGQTVRQIDSNFPHRVSNVRSV